MIWASSVLAFNICSPEAAHGRIDHSSAGAVFAAENSEPLAFLIAGHHGGLPDSGELKHRLKCKSGAAEIHEALSLARGEFSQVVPQSRLEGNLPAFLGNNRRLNLSYSCGCCSAPWWMPIS